MSSRSANNSNAIRVRNSINAANGTRKEVIKLPRAQRGRDSACRSTAPAVPWGLLPGPDVRSRSEAGYLPKPRGKPGTRRLSLKHTGRTRAGRTLARQEV